MADTITEYHQSWIREGAKDKEMSIEIDKLRKENKSKFRGELFAEFGSGPNEALIYPVPIKTSHEYDEKNNYLVVTRQGSRVIAISTKEREVIEEIETAIKSNIKYNKEHKFKKRSKPFSDLPIGFEFDNFFNTEKLKLGDNLVITPEGLKRKITDKEIANENCKLSIVDNEAEVEEILAINREKCLAAPVNMPAKNPQGV
jgi:hypothetical protein